ncbi:MAG: hypothetical protein WAN59_01245 [Candidatus Baltobacteraceae bacterium]
MDRRPKSTASRCSHCGRTRRKPSPKRRLLRARTYQLVATCACCGAAFAALSRN